MSREVLLLLSDTHGGSDVGLCNPETKLWDKRARSAVNPDLSSTQSMLWESFTRHIGKAKTFVDNDPLIIAHLGDITHGSVFLKDVIEARLMGQYQIAKYNMYKLAHSFPSTKALLMVEGTEVHTYDGSVEYLLADHLRDKFPFSVNCYPHTLLRIGETTHDLAHHGPSPGKKVWTKQNTAASWLRNMMIREIMAGGIPNTVTYRGHFHEWTPTITHREVAGSNGDWVQHESHFQFIPGYSGLSDHARKATRSESVMTWGMVAVEIIDKSKVFFYPMVDFRDTRVREEVVYDK